MDDRMISVDWVDSHHAHKNMNTTIIPGLIVFTAVIIGARRYPNQPPQIRSMIRSMIFGLAGVGGLISSLISYRAALQRPDSDVLVPIVSLMRRISGAELFIGLACLAGSVIFFFISRRQRRDQYVA
jgi:hypothetical protein